MCLRYGEAESCYSELLLVSVISGMGRIGSGLGAAGRGRVAYLMQAVTAAAAAAGLSPSAYVEGELQLFGGNTDSGRLGLFHAGEWGAVCSNSWGLAEASVACRMLGFERSFQAMAMPAPPSTPVWLSSVRCGGNESSLLDCSADRWRAGNCSASDAVGVSCLAAGIGGPYTSDVAQIIDDSLARLREQPGAESLAEGSLQLSSVGSDTTCIIRAGVPLPFGTASSSYVFGEQLAPFFAEQDKIMRGYLCDLHNGDALQSKLLRWSQQGLIVNSFGIDASMLLGDGALPHWAPGIPVRSGTAGATDIVKQRDTDAMMLTLRRIYLGGDGLDQLHWQIDLRARPRFPVGLAGGNTQHASDLRARRLLDTLYHEGFVSLTTDDLNLDLEQLQYETKALLAAGANRSIVSVTNLGSVRSARAQISSLEPTLHSELISSVVRGYLGNNTMLHGYKVNELNRPVAKKGDGAGSYISSLWHHDRAGRRLKLFVFLHDVDCELGRPTQVALGSHRYG